MRNIVRQSARLALLVPLAVAPLAVGCATTEPVVTTSSTVNRTVLYPGGRYQLYGDGVATPYHWVWIPTGGNIVNSPPPLPTVPVNTVVTTTPVPAGAGQYQLYGNGTTTPFYWVWVPNGATPPPPPLPPRM